MNEEILIDAMGEIDESLILEIEKLRSKNSIVFPYKAVALIAACFLLTVILLPWGTIFSNKNPSEDPHHSHIGTDILENDDTSSFDTTKENVDIPAPIPQDTQNSTDSTNMTEKNDESYIPETLPPFYDTTLPHIPPTENSKEDETTRFEEETTGPFIPEKPSTPDQEIPLPQYPTVLSHTVYPVYAMYPSAESQLGEWRIDLANRINGYKNGIGNTDSFISKTVSEFFSNSESKNLIYSPVNAYMTLGMLTETTGGSSRDQLLGLLGENDIYSLRSSAKNLWNSCYRDDGIVTSILGSSMWLDNAFTPKTAVTDILSKDYYASSYYGDMGSLEYDELMRSWISEETKGFLDPIVSDSRLDPESPMSLMSTVYYKAEWAEKFEADSTRNMTFHSNVGDVTAHFMYRDFVGLRYLGNNFKATSLELKEGGQMWFLLPNKDVSLNSLFSDPEALGFITGKSQQTLSFSEHSAYMWLFLPKFDISSRVELKNNLNGMGITDVFDPAKADFSSLTDSSIFVNGITQSARISIDEEGCEAAAVSGGVYPEGEKFDDENSSVFVLDRPFIFVVTSDSGLPLFVGTVYHPNLQ